MEYETSKGYSHEEINKACDDVLTVDERESKKDLPEYPSEEAILKSFTDNIETLQEGLEDPALALKVLKTVNTINNPYYFEVLSYKACKFLKFNSDLIEGYAISSKNHDLVRECTRSFLGMIDNSGRDEQLSIRNSALESLEQIFAESSNRGDVLHEINPYLVDIDKLGTDDEKYCLYARDLLGVIASNSYLLRDGINNGDKLIRDECALALCNLTRNEVTGSIGEQAKTSLALNRHAEAEALLGLLPDFRTRHQYRQFYSDMFITEEARNFSENAIKNYVNDSNQPINERLRLIADFVNDKSPTLHNEGHQLTLDFLNNYDLGGKIMSIWTRCSGMYKNGYKDADHYQLSETFRTNMEAITRLEEAKPGITLALNSEFGITCFARYSDEALIKQYEQKDQNQLSYGVVLFPYDDWNGAFRHMDGHLEELRKGVEVGYALRIYEHGNKKDIARELVSMNQKYGPLQFALIGGHGSKDSIQFGTVKNVNSNPYELATEDLLGLKSERSGRFFSDGATIILSSCSTGIEGGIGQTLSEKFGVKVIAPNVPTAISQIHSKIDEDGKPLFEVDYYKDNASMRYNAGQRSE